MESIFRNQERMRGYIRAIQDDTERLLTEAAVSKAIGIWMSDPSARAQLMSEPMDVLLFAKAVHAFLGDRDVVEGILNGKYKSIEELSDVF